MDAAVKAALRKLVEALPARVRPPVVTKSRSLRHRMALSHIKRFNPWRLEAAIQAWDLALFGALLEGFE